MREAAPWSRIFYSEQDSGLFLPPKMLLYLLFSPTRYKENLLYVPRNGPVLVSSSRGIRLRPAKIAFRLTSRADFALAFP